MAELGEALRKTPPGGAEGPDELPPRLLKELGVGARRFMLGIFNQSWREGVLPQAWRNAVIVPILKPGKPPGRVDSYRPISLTSCLGKVFERMVAKRLSHIAETRGLLTEDQAGFRGLRSTEDQVLRISQTVSDGFQAKPAKRSVLALLDFSKAYDTVWRTLLMSDLLAAGVPYPYIRWIGAFLTNRLGKVRLEGGSSEFRQFREGLPQGSVLSPLLFLFFIDGLRSRIRSSLTSMYADDVALLVTAASKEAAAAICEADVREVWRWSRERKLCLNLGKCEVGFFSPDPGESGWQPRIEVEGHALQFNPNPVFLGVVFDRTLSFRAQVDRVTGRMAAGARLLSAVSGQQWGWSGGDLRSLYRAIPLAAARYCAAGWQPWLASTAVQDLDRAQSRCLRRITGQYASAPLEAVRREAGFCSFLTLSRQEACIAWEKSLRLPAANPRRRVAEEVVRHRSKRNSWRKVATAESAALHLDRLPRAPLPVCTAAPWEWGGEGLQICLALRGGWTVRLKPKRS